MQIKAGGAPRQHFLNTSVVLVLFGYWKGARKVCGKCIKGTPGVLRRCLQGTRLSITCVIIIHEVPPADKRNFWLTCTSLDQLQLQQQDPVLGPALAAWPATPSNMKERSMQVLVQQLVPSMVPEREKCDPPLWAGWPTSWYPWAAGSAQLNLAQCPREVRDISSCERCTVVPCFRKKEGNMMLGMVVR